MIDINILSEPLDLSGCMAAVADSGCGGIVSFTGAVRDNTHGKDVVRLEYECYRQMALQEMRKIAEDAIRLYDVKKILIHHRTGVLLTGETAVIIVVAAPHRDAAFLACRYAIDTLKKTVPIWKKEIFGNGEEVWSAQP